MASTHRAITLSGTIVNRKTQSPVFLAHIRDARSRALVSSDLQGAFAIAVPSKRRDRSIELVLIARECWPRRIKIDIPASSLQSHIILSPDQTAIEPFPDFFNSGIVGYLSSWAGPRFLGKWLALTRGQKVLASLLLGLVGLPVLAGAVVSGFRIPATSADEHFLEAWQRVPWLPESTAEVAYDEIRQRYYEGVRYRVSSGTAPAQGVRIEPGAIVTIEPGAQISFPAGAGMHVEGRLTAVAGPGGDRITFAPAVEHERWSNITFWGRGSAESRLDGCTITRGSGIPAIGSDSGAFELADTGEHVGGGLLLFDTTIQVSNTIISDCTARYGGGVFIRNALRPDGAEQPGGSRFIEVTIAGCTATHAELAGGGAVLIKNAFPEFTRCTFTGNRADGLNSCGGALYVGIGGRAWLDHCQFIGNAAAAEGGAGYILRSLATDHAETSGVRIRGGRIAGNSANGAGGGFSLCEGPLAISGTVIEDNRVSPRNYKDGARASGGGVYVEATVRPASLEMHGCTLSRNRIDISPALSGDAASGGAIAARSARPVIRLALSHNDYCGNSAPRGAHLSLPDPGCITWPGLDPDSRLQLPAGSETAAVWIATRAVPAAPEIAAGPAPAPLPAVPPAPAPALSPVGPVVAPATPAAEVPGQ